MTAAIEVVQAAAATSTGTQDITTTDLGGTTPKAALVFISLGTVAGTEVVHANYGAGFTDGTKQFFTGNMSADNEATTKTSIAMSNNSLVIVPDPSARTIDGSADFDSWITNGIRIDWTNAPTNAVLLTVVFFAGDDVSAHADEITNVTVTDPINVTAPGFEPDLVFGFSTTLLGDFITTANYRNGGFLSVHHNGASIVARHLVMGAFNNSASSLLASRLHTTNTEGHIDAMNFAAVISSTFKISAFDADGFTIEAGATGTPGSTIDFGYLAIQVANHDCYLDDYDPPTSTDTSYEDTGNQPGFEPQFVMLGASMHTALDTAGTTDPSAGVMGYGVFTPDAEAYVGMREDAGATTTDCGSMADTKAVAMLDETGSAVITATFVSMNTSDFTLNYSAADGTQRKFWQLCIGAAAAGIQNNITFAAGLNDVLATLGLFQNTRSFRTGLSDTKAPTSIFQAIRSFDLGLAASHLGEIVSAIVDNTITFALGLAESKVAQSIFNRTISFGIGLRDTLSSLIEGIVENTITFAVGFAESKVVNSVFASVISFGAGFRDLLNTTGVFNHFITFAIGLRDLLSPSVITSKTITFATGFAARHVGNIIEVLEGVITFGLGLADNLVSTSRRTWELTVRAVSVWRKPDNSK